jgi:hypothetical protein
VLVASNPPTYVDVRLESQPVTPLRGYDEFTRPVPLLEQTVTAVVRHDGVVQARKCVYDAIPMINGDAITGYASQGRTFKNIAICISNYFKGSTQNVGMLFYVSITRCTKCFEFVL